MFDKQPSLASDSLLIRPLREADFDALYVFASDPTLWALNPARDRQRLLRLILPAMKWLMIWKHTCAMGNGEQRPQSVLLRSQG